MEKTQYRVHVVIYKEVVDEDQNIQLEMEPIDEEVLEAHPTYEPCKKLYDELVEKYNKFHNEVMDEA